jgi:hypothetical protein
MEFPANLSTEKRFMGIFLQVFLWNYLRIVSSKIFCGFDLIFGRKFRRKLRIQNSAGKPNLHEIPQEMCFLQIFCPNP